MCDLLSIKEEIEKRKIKSGHNFMHGANSDILELLKTAFPYIANIKYAKTGLYLTALYGNFTEPPKCPMCGGGIMSAKGKNFSKFCSADCSRMSPDVEQKRKDTMMLKYGVEHSLKFEQFKQKTIQTKIDRYGTANTSSLACVKEKKLATNMQRYGVDNPMQSDEIKQRLKSTNLSRYGFDCSFQSEEVKRKIRETNFARYGTDNPAKCQQIKERIQSTNVERYGNGCSLLGDGQKEKTIRTNVERYGFENPSSSLMIREKVKRTNLDRYGVDCSFQSEEVKRKIRETNFIRYGADHYKQQHFSDFIDNLNETSWLEGHYIGHFMNSEMAASSIGIHKSTYLEYLHKHNLSHLVYSSHTSSGELEVSSFIKSIYEGEIVFNDRKVLNGLELDIYLPSENIAIEFNGVYWHSHLFKDKKYHQQKALKCMEIGINLIQIWEDDWRNLTRREILKLMLMSKLGMIKESIYARTTHISIIEPSVASLFLETFHVQGKTSATAWIGLYDRDSLVAVMGIKELKRGCGEWDIVRFATSKSVVGGFSKILNYFKKQYEWKSIISFANLDYSHGNMYKKCGFEMEYITQPSLHFLVNGVRVRREHYMKHKLPLIFPDYDGSHVDTFLESKGIYRIYDSGKIKFMMRID
jgi:hypothetical protein